MRNPLGLAIETEGGHSLTPEPACRFLVKFSRGGDGKGVLIMQAGQVSATTFWQISENDFPSDGAMKEKLYFLLRYAIPPHPATIPNHGSLLLIKVGYGSGST